MKCPHCAVSFHDNWQNYDVIRSHQAIAGWMYRNAHCPACNDVIIEIGFFNINVGEFLWRLVYPAGANRGPVPASVPAALASDYIEACNVLPISAKASAALSRRCLQNILHANGYRERDLAREIDAFLNEQVPAKAPPDSLRDVVDGIRNFGNFSAHPITDVTSLQIIDVEPEEAEWCLEILEEMFQHFYERPAQAAARKAALNAKLAQAGKPPAK